MKNEKWSWGEGRNARNDGLAATSPGAGGVFRGPELNGVSDGLDDVVAMRELFIYGQHL